MTRILKVWEKRFKEFDEGGPITNSLILQISKVLNNSSSGCQALVNLLWEKTVKYKYTISWKLTAQQTEKGLKFLKSKEIQKLMTDDQKEIVDSFKEFRYVGACAYCLAYHRRSQFLPTYRVISSDGRWFEYISSNWQTNWQNEFVPRFEVIRANLD